MIRIKQMHLSFNHGCWFYANYNHRFSICIRYLFRKPKLGYELFSFVCDGKRRMSHIIYLGWLLITKYEQKSETRIEYTNTW